MTGLVAALIYRQINLSRPPSRLLHPAYLRIASRPQGVASNPVERFPESAPSQVAILLTKSNQDAESAVRCLKAMGIPFFVTLDLHIALRHKLRLLYPEVDGTTFNVVE